MLFGSLLTLCILLALLSIPITLAFQISELRSPRTSCTFIWLFGLVRIKARLRPGKKAVKKKAAQKNKKHHRKKRGFYAFRLIAQPELRRHLISSLMRFVHAVKHNDVQLNMRIGLNNPADTGVLWGCVGPIAGWLGALKSLSVRITPEFNQQVFELNGQGNLRFIPLQLVYLSGALILSPIVLKSLMRARSWRK